MHSNQSNQTDNFLESSVEFMNNYSFEFLKKYFLKIDNEKKVWILPLFYHFEPDEAFEFLLHFSFNSIIKNEKILTIFKNECKYLMLNYSKLSDKSHLLCQNCFIRPKVKNVRNIQFLSCPKCNLVKYLKPGYYNIIAVIGKKIHEKEIEVWKENKIKIIEASSIILRPERNVDFDWAITSFLHEFELQYPQKTINIVLENVQLQENTLRFIQDQVKFNLVIQK